MKLENLTAKLVARNTVSVEKSIHLEIFQDEFRKKVIDLEQQIVNRDKKIMQLIIDNQTLNERVKELMKLQRRLKCLTEQFRRRKKQKLNKSHVSILSFNRKSGVSQSEDSLVPGTTRRKLIVARQESLTLLATQFIERK